MAFPASQPEGEQRGPGSRTDVLVGAQWVSGMEDAEQGLGPFFLPTSQVHFSKLHPRSFGEALLPVASQLSVRTLRLFPGAVLVVTSM